MKLPPMKLGATEPGSEAGSPRSFWSMVLTATPVILTVVATVLAGLSSRELTLSQYHRTLAAQNQSKAGDQWNFFQAKRSRRTNHENTADLLQVHAESSAVDATAVEAAAAFLLQRLRRADSEASDLLRRLGTAADAPGAGGAALHQAALRLQQTVRDNAKQADQARQRIRELFSRSETRAAWAYLNRNERPQVDIPRVADPRIEEARQAASAHRPDEETARVFRQIPDDILRNALATAEANVQAVEHAYEPVSETLKQIEQVVQEQIRLGGSFHEAVRQVEAAAIDLPDATGQSPAGVRTAVAALSRSAQVVHDTEDALYANFKTAWHDYQARRYQHEGELNRQAAEVYEMQVRKSSALAERHRDRSKDFFFGMLAAQAGVTLATFSLAVRQKSVLWGLASLMGIGAIFYSLYVHVYL